MVFVADPEGYVPIQPVRPTRPAKKTASSAAAPAAAASSTASTPASSPPPGRLQTAASDSPEYRAPLETWDRDYRRLRSNNTRVQREYSRGASAQSWWLVPADARGGRRYDGMPLIARIVA